jgi:two-component system, OmpR family, osmolarity sensor histidine kinase EnvZ
VRKVFDSLLLRISALFIVGLGCAQAALLAAILWPDDRPALHRIIDGTDARQIAEAIESSHPDARAALAAAASHGATLIRILPSQKAEPRKPAAGPVSRLSRRYGAWIAELDGRPVRIVTGGDPATAASPEGERLAGPVRILIGLRTGQTLAIERSPLLLRALYSRYASFSMIAGVALVAVVAAVLWQIVRPIRKLVAATEAFRRGETLPRVVEEGAIEVRELARAFNAMQDRILDLIAERTRMLAAIAHDLRTYLTRLQLRTAYIRDGRQRSKAEADLTEMSVLLDDVLLFARSEATPCEEAPVIDAAAEVARYVQTRREMGDDVRPGCPDPDASLCRCSPVALRRILSNLVDNAIRYGGRATLAVTADSRGVHITISDEGPGIPSHLVPVVLRPFERLEPSRGRVGGGAGLGLSIVQALTESQGGELFLENRPGGGLVVQVSFPSPAAGSCGDTAPITSSLRS